MADFKEGDIVTFEGDRACVFYEVGGKNGEKVLLVNNTMLTSNFYADTDKLTLIASVENRNA